MPQGLQVNKGLFDTPYDTPDALAQWSWKDLWDAVMRTVFAWNNKINTIIIIISNFYLQQCVKKLLAGVEGRKTYFNKQID